MNLILCAIYLLKIVLYLLRTREIMLALCLMGLSNDFRFNSKFLRESLISLSEALENDASGI